jgi:hypothetical protein
MRTASWVLLAIAGVLIVLGGVVSVYVAYARTGDNLMPGGPTVDALEAVHPGLGDALRGRRATASAFSIAYGVLFLYVVLGPYRRGDVGSWWALLAASLALALFILARIPFLGMRTGSGTGLVQLAVVIVGLLLDVRRLGAPADVGAGSRP